MPDAPDSNVPAEAGAQARWIPLAALLALPFVYLGVLVAPAPLGCGLFFGNDFSAHRIWYAQMDAYFLSKGYVPLWNPAFEMGTPYLGMCFGTGFLYPLRWWTVALTFLGGTINYVAQYAQVALHMSLALGALYAILRRFAGVSREAAALGAAVFLLNQSFNNFIRFPHGVEDMAWVPPMLYFALSLAERGDPRRVSDRRAYAIECLALALCVALGWLTGYGQYTYVGGLFVGIVVLCVAQTPAGVAGVLLAGAMGTVAALGTLWPTLEWVANHPLRNGRDIANINVQGVTDYADMLLHPFGVDVHFSMFTLPHFALLSVIGVLAARSWKNGRLSIAMLLCLMLVLDVSRGLRGFSFEFLFKHLPGFSAFNSPSKIAWMAVIPLAWFGAIAVDALGRSRLRKIIAFLICLAAGAVLAVVYAPSVPPGQGIWKPQAVGWIGESQTSIAYGWMTLGGGAMTGLYLLVRSQAARGLILCGLCTTFALAFARYNTFLEKQPDPKALLASKNAFPDGLLARRSDAGYLGLTGVGVVSENVDPIINALMRENDGRYRGPAGARFPASRFLWIPDASSDALGLKLTSFGPNQIDFDLTARGPGRLIYLAKFSPHWTCNHAYQRSTLCNEFYEFRIDRGNTYFEMEFAPASHIVLAIWTLMSVFAMGAALLAMVNRKKMALAISLAAPLVCTALLAGALNRRSMSQRDLFGVDGRSNDPAGLVAPYTLR